MRNCLLDRTGQSRRARPLRDTLRNLVQEGVVTQYDGPTERVFYVSLDSQHRPPSAGNTVIHFPQPGDHRTRGDPGRLRIPGPGYQARGLGERNATAQGHPEVQSSSSPDPDPTRSPRRRVVDVSRLGGGRRSTESVIEEAGKLEAGALAHRVIGPFLEAYSVLADELAAAGDQTVEQAALVETPAWPGSGGCSATPRSRSQKRLLRQRFPTCQESGPGRRRGTGPRRTPTGVSPPNCDWRCGESTIWRGSHSHWDNPHHRTGDAQPRRPQWLTSEWLIEADRQLP